MFFDSPNACSHFQTAVAFSIFHSSLFLLLYDDDDDDDM
jgi:hypothetical protein